MRDRTVDGGGPVDAEVLSGAYSRSTRWGRRASAGGTLLRFSERARVGGITMVIANRKDGAVAVAHS